MGVLLEAWVFDVGIDHDEVLFSFALKSRGLVLSVGWHVFEEQSPDLAAMIYVEKGIL